MISSRLFVCDVRIRRSPSAYDVCEWKMYIWKNATKIISNIKMYIRNDCDDFVRRRPFAIDSWSIITRRFPHVSRTWFPTIIESFDLRVVGSHNLTNAELSNRCDAQFAGHGSAGERRVKNDAWCWSVLVYRPGAGAGGGLGRQIGWSNKQQVSKQPARSFAPRSAEERPGFYLLQHRTGNRRTVIV